MGGELPQASWKYHLLAHLKNTMATFSKAGYNLLLSVAHKAQ
jgi:hypothetical protein